MGAMEVMEVMVSGEFMPTSEKEKKGPTLRISKNVIIIFIVSLFAIIFLFYLYSIIPPEASSNGTAEIPYDIEAEMQFIIDSCISEEIKDHTALPFVKDDIKLCESYKNKTECEFVYYTLNILDGVYFNDCNDIIDPEVKNFCISLKNNNALSCEKISYEANRNACKAIITNDVSICDQIANEIWHKECINVFYIHKGMTFKDLTECENIQELEEKYEYNWFNSQKLWCSSVVSKNASLYEDVLEERCEEQFIGMILNTSLCYKLESENKIRSCEDKINRIFDCTNESDSKSCIDNIINLSIFCEKLPLPSPPRDYLLYTTYKFIEDNPDICT